MLGKTACKHEVELESCKNATTVEIANHKTIPREMAFCVWWHLSGNFVFTEPERAGGKYRAKPLRELLEHRKSYRCNTELGNS